MIFNMIFKNWTGPAGLIGSIGNRAPVRSGKNPQNRWKPAKTRL